VSLGRSARPGRASAWTAVAALVACGWGGTVVAQPLRPDRPVTRVVGTPPGGARVDRVDSQRTGASSSLLPCASLAVAWRATVKAQLEHAPVVDARGGIYVVGTRGEIVALATDGAERWQVATGASGASAPTLLSDDTIVFVDGSGTVFGARDDALRWKTRAGVPDPALPVAPLALDLGGVVVAVGGDLVALDGTGHEVARVRLGESVAAPLLSSSDRVIAVTSSGAVWTWAPGAPEAARAGTFESPVEGDVALVSDDTALAVTHGGARLTELHLPDGMPHIRASAGGALWPGSPAVAAGVAYVVAFTATSELAVAFDGSGRTIGSALLQSQPQAGPSDGGALMLLADRPEPLVVDRAGTAVFTTTTGAVGAVRHLGLPDEGVESVAGVCATRASMGASPFAGIAPLGPHRVVASCRHGELVAIAGAGGG
jgi:outer membrane protein assembly factor BamB